MKDQPVGQGVIRIRVISPSERKSELRHRCSSGSSGSSWITSRRDPRSRRGVASAKHVSILNVILRGTGSCMRHWFVATDRRCFAVTVLVDRFAEKIILTARRLPTRSLSPSSLNFSSRPRGGCSTATSREMEQKFPRNWSSEVVTTFTRACWPYYVVNYRSSLSASIFLKDFRDLSLLNLRPLSLHSALEFDLIGCRWSQLRIRTVLEIFHGHCRINHRCSFFRNGNSPWDFDISVVLDDGTFFFFVKWRSFFLRLL